MLIAMIKKEFLLVLRDKHALMALFIMPAIFILIMSVAMRDQFSAQNIVFSIYLENLDQSKLSRFINKNIQNDVHFDICETKNDADFIISIPKNYTKSDIKIELIVQGSIKSDQIQVFKSMLSKHILNAKLAAITNLEISTENLYTIKYNSSALIPNSTQQSVPAWIVFGMFFIIIPMSTIYVNERQQNTLARLNSMNISVIDMTISKSIPYMLINQLQVWIMIGVGMFIVPYFNAPALSINGSISAIVAVSFALSICAIGVSTLIAVTAKTSEQATTIGGILNILLGAVGGIMVPKFIMPKEMQNIAEFSPMSWGLDGFLAIFLNSAELPMVMDEVLKLTLLGLVLLGISMIVLQKRIAKGL